MSDTPLGRPEGDDPQHSGAEPPGEDHRPSRQAGPSRAPAAPGEGVRIITAEEVEAARQRSAAGAPGGTTGADNAATRAGSRPGDTAASPPAATFPLGADRRPEDVERPRLRPLPTASGTGGLPEGGPPTQPVSAVGSSGAADLPHWTEPPTGEVPQAVASPGDDERWAARAQGPRWRDEHERWDDGDMLADLAPDDDNVDDDLGALDPARPRQATEASFDDLDVPDGTGIGEAAGVGAAGGTGARPGARATGASGPMAGRTRPGGGGGNGGDGAGPSGRSGDRNMGQAVGVGVAIAGVALLLAWLGAPWLLALVAVVVVAAAAEYLSALKRAGLEPPMMLGVVAAAALPLAAYARGDAAIAMVLFLLLVFAMVWFLVGAGPGRPVRDIGTMLLAVVHVGVFGAFAALILRIGPIGDATIDQGVSILVLAVVAGVFYDVGGLFTGRRFGRTPLSSASPNKTREGLIGGMIVSIAAVFIAAFFPLFGLTEFSFLQVLVFAVACSVAAFLGDLSESLIKRDLGLKDMGDLLPGHGGVLDRFDGMLFVLPTAYYVVLVLFS